MNPLLNPPNTQAVEYIVFTIAEIRPYTAKELCSFYRISDKTLTKWLQPFKKDIGHKRGMFYTVTQVELIFKVMGMPYEIRRREEVRGAAA